MKIRLALFLSLAFAASLAHARDIALTFDDCPRKTGKLMTGLERAKKLTEEFKKAKIKQVAFFCNSPKRTPDGVQRLEHFAREGHLIANHSANHDDLYKTDMQIFNRTIMQAHFELSRFQNYRRWFRFPYLHEGKDPTTVKSVRTYLFKHGYKNGYVTVDNNDWYMDDLLGKVVASGRKFNKEKMCSTYKEILADEADFYDDMSVKALGRSVKHVLLLHETDMNAFCIGDLAAELRKRGWNIISPDEAFSDPIADQDPDPSVKLNQGRVLALAQEKGYKGPFYSKWTEEEDMAKEFEKRGAW